MAEVAQKRIRSTGHVVGADGRREVLDGGEGARQRLVGQPAGLVDPLPEPDDARLAHQHLGQVGDQQLDGVGAAVDRGDQGHDGSASGATHGPLGPPLPQPGQHLVAEHVDARPGGQRVGGQDVEALHAGRHPTGGDAGELGDVAERGPVGEVGGMGGGVGRGEPGVVAEPGLHLLHQPGALEGADQRGGARAGQVVGRRERRAVGQPGLGGHDVGQGAGAAMADRAGTARRTPELRLDRGQVGVGDRTRPVGHAAGHPPWRPPRYFSGCGFVCADGGSPASWTDLHSVVHQAVGVEVVDVRGSLRRRLRGQGLAVGADHDVRRLAGHQVAEAGAGLLLDVGRVVPARPSRPGAG